MIIWVALWGIDSTRSVISLLISWMEPVFEGLLGIVIVVVMGQLYIDMRVCQHHLLRTPPEIPAGYQFLLTVAWSIGRAGRRKPLAMRHIAARRCLVRCGLEVTTDQKVKGSSPFGCASYARRKLKDPTLDTTWRKVVS